MICSQEKIEYGKQTIKFDLVRESRKTLSINVLPSLDVQVKAPIEQPIEKIFAKIKTRAKWISKQQQFFNGKFHFDYFPKFISGETHLYLGKQYRLKNVIDKKTKTVKLKNGYFIISCSNNLEIENLLKNWYKEKAAQVFEQQLDFCFKDFRKYGIKKPLLKIRKFKKRWGSYNKSKNIITLNIDLIKTNKICINYVLYHELSHCLYYNHNTQFYELLEKHCKNWKSIKNKLEGYNL